MVTVAAPLLARKWGSGMRLVVDEALEIRAKQARLRGQLTKLGADFFFGR
jgi:hypothetical protein